MKMLVAIALVVVSCGAALATPGTVRKGTNCHKSHCHSAGEINTASNGRRYVPGHFGHYND